MARRVSATVWPRWLSARMRSSRLCAPICTLVTPRRRSQASSSGVISSGRVSITRPTLRWAAVSLMALGFCQAGEIDAVHGVEAALDEPFLVVAAVGAPGAAQDQQLDLVGGVADGLVATSRREATCA